MIASGPSVSHGIAMSDFARVWLVESFYFFGSGAENN